MSGSERITILAGSTPLAQGSVRQIWNRPGHPDQLLKIIHHKKIQKYENKNAFRQILSDRRHGPYRSFKIEYWYYSRTAYRCLKAGRDNPIVEMGGLIATNRGLAQVVEKITDKSGALGRTLKDLLATKGLTDTHVEWLNTLADTLYTVNISVPDLSLANIVCDETRNQFLVVDGYGDKAMLPFRSWIRPLNHKKLDERFAKMSVPGFLTWNGTLKKFSLL